MDLARRCAPIAGSCCAAVAGARCWRISAVIAERLVGCAGPRAPLLRGMLRTVAMRSGRRCVRLLAARLALQAVSGRLLGMQRDRASAPCGAVRLPSLHLALVVETDRHTSAREL